MGGPTVNLIITSSLSIQYKEKQPFTVFQTALQNTLILRYLYQCDRIIYQQRINRKQNSFSFPVTHYLFCVCVLCVCVVHGLGPWESFCIGLSFFFFFFFFFWGGGCVFARNSTCCGTSKVCDVMFASDVKMQDRHCDYGFIILYGQNSK